MQNARTRTYGVQSDEIKGRFGDLAIAYVDDRSTALDLSTATLRTGSPYSPLVRDCSVEGRLSSGKTVTLTFEDGSTLDVRVD